MEFGLPDSTCATIRQILTSDPQIKKPFIGRVRQVLYERARIRS